MHTSLIRHEWPQQLLGKVDSSAKCFRNALSRQRTDVLTPPGMKARKNLMCLQLTP